MIGKKCQVRYKDLEGVLHTVEVTAESVYEASVLALSALSKHEWIENVGPGRGWTSSSSSRTARTRFWSRRPGWTGA